MSADQKHITIRRERGFYGIFRKLIVLVDNVELLRIKSGETCQAVLPASAAALSLRMDWITTPPFDLADIGSGDTLAIYVTPRSFKDMRSLKEIPFAIRVEPA